VGDQTKSLKAASDFDVRYTISSQDGTYTANVIAQTEQAKSSCRFVLPVNLTGWSHRMVLPDGLTERFYRMVLGLGLGCSSIK
jgi:hypothetical protein